MNYLKRVPRPAPDSINSGLSPAKQATALAIWGKPRAALCSDCMPVTNSKLRSKIVTAKVGPFECTGHSAFIALLKDLFAEVKEEEPLLYELVGSAGCLCARRVRTALGNSPNWSNHSFGTAIDLTIGGQLDGVADGMTIQGLLSLYKYFHARKCYWGAEFSREDSMHFEASNELLLKWKAEGKA